MKEPNPIEEAQLSAGYTPRRIVTNGRRYRIQYLGHGWQFVLDPRPGYSVPFETRWRWRAKLRLWLEDREEERGRSESEWRPL